MGRFGRVTLHGAARVCAVAAFIALAQASVGAGPRDGRGGGRHGRHRGSRCQRGRRGGHRCAQPGRHGWRWGHTVREPRVPAGRLRRQPDDHGQRHRLRSLRHPAALQRRRLRTERAARSGARRADLRACDNIFRGAARLGDQRTQGRFTLENVRRASTSLVIQTGKWRRVITIPAVTECVDNRSRPGTDAPAEEHGRGQPAAHRPVDGRRGSLFCLLRRLGIDDTEYGIAGSTGRFHFFRGANGSTRFDDGFGASPGATFPDAPSTLWNTDWTNYDMVLLSCEGDELPGPKNGHRVALRDYLDAGGRVFATHYHYNWFQGDAPADLQSVATFTSNANGFEGPVDIDQTFPKGVALAEWMAFVDGSSPLGQFHVVDGRRTPVSLTVPSLASGCATRARPSTSRSTRPSPRRRTSSAADGQHRTSTCRPAPATRRRLPERLQQQPADVAGEG